MRFSMHSSTLALAGLIGSSFILAACSDNAEPGPAAAVAARDASRGAPVTLEDLPTQRTGIWRTTMSVNGDPQKPVRECVAANQPLLDEEAGMSGCSPSVQRLPTGFRLEGQCRSDGVSSHITADITGDFQRRVKVNMQTSQSLPGQEAVTLNIQTESVYEGACAPGQGPGKIEE